MQHFAPIALFVYNRPEHTRRTIKFLSQNLLADESRLFIFSDGAKTQKDVQLVEQVRELISQIEGFKSVEVIIRQQNLGLANSIIDGVTRLVNEYGRIIVFEDDLISSPYTLKYLNEGLERFEHHNKIMHIGAYMFPIRNNNLPQTFFYRVATSWGWATWASAWKNFQPDIDKLIKQFDEKKINDFSIDCTMNFWKQVIGFKQGKNNSWAIRWYASIFLAGGLTLNPSRSLVNNIGHDGTGIHSGLNTMYQVQVNADPIDHFPETIEENKEAYEAIKQFLIKRKGNWAQRIIRFLKEKIKT